MKNKKITELINVEYPIVQAPMAGVQGSALTVAVSKAGGLGSLPCAMLDLEAMHAELMRITEQTTRPYNLNFFCHKPPQEDLLREQQWHVHLAPYYRELGLDPEAVPQAAARHPFNQAMVDLIRPFCPPVVSFHFGLPAPELLDQVKAWGAKVMSSATTVEEAIWLQRHGADVIIAQGLEAGGHRGMFLSEDITTQVGTLSLLPQILHAVDLPVLAAGGIACAHGVKAALQMGAAGVQVGTAYLLCPEANTSAAHRQALVSDAACHTALTNVMTGRPARSIVNRLISEVGPISPLAPAFPGAATAVAPLRAAAERAGSGDFSPLWAGQNTSGCCELPAGELTLRLASGIESA